MLESLRRGKLLANSILQVFLQVRIPFIPQGPGKPDDGGFTGFELTGQSGNGEESGLVAQGEDLTGYFLLLPGQGREMSLDIPLFPFSRSLVTPIRFRR